MNWLVSAIILLSVFRANLYRSSFWDLIEVDSAWKYSKGSYATLIGIVDMGFDFYHPDLKNSLRPGYFADGVYHPEVYEVIAHGTAVASVIHSLAPNCPILTASTGVIEHTLLKLKKEYELQHPGASLKDFQSEIIKHSNELSKFGKEWKNYVNRTTSEAIKYLADRGVKVINISALLDDCSVLDSAFQYAATHDVVIVIEAGNSNIKYENYPGKGLSNIIVAGASTLNDVRWVTQIPELNIKQGSNFSSRLTVVAPSESLIIAEPHDPRFYKADDSPFGPEDIKFSSIRDTIEYGATSMATAIVSGLVALIRSIRPDLSADEVVSIVKEGAKDIGAPGFDQYTGFGRIDFAKSIEIARRIKK